MAGRLVGLSWRGRNGVRASRGCGAGSRVRLRPMRTFRSASMGTGWLDTDQSGGNDRTKQ
jgi:hypothetical protein